MLFTHVFFLTCTQEETVVVWGKRISPSCCWLRYCDLGPPYWEESILSSSNIFFLFFFLPVCDHRLTFPSSPGRTFSSWPFPVSPLPWSSPLLFYSWAGWYEWAAYYPPFWSWTWPFLERFCTRSRFPLCPTHTGIPTASQFILYSASSSSFSLLPTPYPLGSIGLWTVPTNLSFIFSFSSSVRLSHTVEYSQQLASGVCDWR